MLIKTSLLLTGLIAPPSFGSLPCYRDLRALRNAQILPFWRETTANDGKPLDISVSDRDGELYVEIIKAKESWISGPAQICRTAEHEISVKLLAGMKLGNSLPLMARMALKAHPELRMKENGPQKMHVSTWAWGGDFKGSPSSYEQ